MTSAEGRPLQGATVRVPELGRSTATDERGRFVLPGLPRGRFRVVVQHLAYESAVRVIRTDGSPSLRLSLRPTALPAEPIVVTATAGALDVRDSPLPASVVTAEELDATSAVSLTHTLEELPGVRNLSTGEQVGKPVIRGLSGPRVAVRESGLPLSYLDWSDEDAPALDGRLAGSVEVVRGPASVLYGGGAIGGVVNVLPEPLPGRPNGPATLSGSAELYGASNNREGGGFLQMEGAAGSLGWRISGALRSGDNLHTPEGEIGNTGYRALNGRAAVGLHESWGTLALRYAHFGGEFELLEAGEEPREPLAESVASAGRTIPGAPGPAIGAKEIRSPDEGPVRESEDDRVQVSADVPFSSGLRLEVTGQFQRHKTEEIPPGGEEGAEEEEEGEFGFELGSTSVRALLHHHQGERTTGVYGVSGEISETEAEGGG